MKVKGLFLTAVLLLCQSAMADGPGGLCASVMKASAGLIAKCQQKGAILTIAPSASVGRTGDAVPRIEKLKFAYELSDLWLLAGVEAIEAIQTVSTNDEYCRVLTRKRYEGGLLEAKQIRAKILERESSSMLGQHYGKNETILFFWERAEKIPCPKMGD